MECKFFPCSIGVRCDGTDKSAVAFINAKGKKKVDVFKKRNRALFMKIPILRGILFFICGFISFFTAFDAMFVDDEILNAKEERSKRSRVIWIAIICGIVIIVWILLLGLLPSKLSFWVLGYIDSPILRNFVIALFKVAILYLLFLLVRFIPAMVELYKFNGACNLMTDKKKGKEEMHRPLNFLNFVVFSFLFAVFVITFIGVSVNILLNWVINLSIFIISICLMCHCII